MEKERAREHLDRLSEYMETEKCRECECLQGAFAQLRTDWPELGEDIDELVTEKVHSCLDCDPCPPADIWEEYLREREE